MVLHRRKHLARCLNLRGTHRAGLASSSPRNLILYSVPRGTGLSPSNRVIRIPWTSEPSRWGCSGAVAFDWGGGGYSAKVSTGQASVRRAVQRGRYVMQGATPDRR